MSPSRKKKQPKAKKKQGKPWGLFFLTAGILLLLVWKRDDVLRLKRQWEAYGRPAPLPAATAVPVATPRPQPHSRPTALPTPRSTILPTPRPTALPSPRPVPTRTAKRHAGPVLAILLDDWGYTRGPLSGLMALPAAVSVAVFPGQAHSREVAEAAWAKGHEVIVHLPLEPKGNLPLIEGTLKAGMTDAALAELAEKDFLSVPHALGANNHEGSKGTEDPRVMRQVLSMLKRHGAFFVDSLTTPRSLAGRMAREAGVPSAVRQVFLDDEDYLDTIEQEFRKAVYLAQKNGSCLAIGHPRPNTMKVLLELVGEAKAAGVELIPISELVK